MKKLLVLLVIVVLMLSACSDAEWDRTWDYGTPKLVVSNGGNCVIQIHISKGRVSVEGGDDFIFTDLRDDRLIQVGGDVFMMDATEDQKDVYLSADTRKEAIDALLLQVQMDGSIVTQSAACLPPE